MSSRSSSAPRNAPCWRKRDDDVQRADLEEAVNSFIDPLDPDLLALQELAAVLACSDRRYLPEHYATADRSQMLQTFGRLKQRLRRIDLQSTAD